MAWIAARLVSSKRETRYASAASWRAMTADDWKRRSVCRGHVSNNDNIRRGNDAYLEVLSNLTNKTLEGELANEQLGRLLVATNFTEGDGTGAEAVRLLDTTGRGRSLSLTRLGSKLLTGGLAFRRVVKLKS